MPAEINIPLLHPVVIDGVVEKAEKEHRLGNLPCLYSFLVPVAFTYKFMILLPVLYFSHGYHVLPNHHLLYSYLIKAQMIHSLTHLQM